MLKPKLLTTLHGYTRQQFAGDAAAGVIVGIVALPLAIAFAIASGVSPEKGLITGIIAGFLISALGGSRVQIGGPVGAFVVIVYGIVHQYGVDGLIVATIMAGIILVIMGLVGFGSIIKFIPYPVVVGFTSGIAIVIFSTQVKDFLGLQIDNVPADFVEKWLMFSTHLNTINIYAVIIALSTLALMIIWPKISRKIPGSLIALVGTTIIVQLFNLPVETIGSRFGSIPSTFPSPALPDISWQHIKELVGPATTIALLTAIESLLSAVVADGMVGGSHRSNMELIAQGVANITAPIFGGIPASGAIARTATNVRNGGRTPVAGIVHALTLLLVMLLFGNLAAKIPLACLAAILVMVAYNMSEWRSVRSILKSPLSDIAVLITTMGLTVIIDLTVAIEVGMVLAAFSFMKRMESATEVSMVVKDFREEGEPGNQPNGMVHDIPKGIQVFELSGPLFFGAAYKFTEAMRIVSKSPKVRILRMRYVNAIDGTGLHRLEEVYHDCKRQGITMLISGVRAQPLTAMTKSGLIHEIGEENVFLSFEGAMEKANRLIEAQIQ